MHRCRARNRVKRSSWSSFSTTSYSPSRGPGGAGRVVKSASQPMSGTAEPFPVLTGGRLGSLSRYCVPEVAPPPRLVVVELRAGAVLGQQDQRLDEHPVE